MESKARHRIVDLQRIHSPRCSRAASNFTNTLPGLNQILTIIYHKERMMSTSIPWLLAGIFKTGHPSQQNQNEKRSFDLWFFPDMLP